MNSVIMSKSPRGKQDHATLPRGISAPLSAKDRHDNIIDTYNELLVVLRFRCLPGLRCLDSRREWYMSTGILQPHPEVFKSWETQCYMCDKSSRKYFLPIQHAGAIKLLKSRKFNDAIAKTELSVDKAHTSLDILFNSKVMKLDVLERPQS